MLKGLISARWSILLLVKIGQDNESLKFLDLSWNYIRGESARVIGESIEVLFAGFACNA